MDHVTEILSKVEHGDRQAAEKLLPLVYDELRKLAAAKLAQEKPGQTLQATALVHEAYLRLVGGEVASSQEPVAGEQANVRRPATGYWPLGFPRALLCGGGGGDAADSGGGGAGGSRVRSGEETWVRREVDELDVPLKQPPEEVLAVHEALEKLAETIAGRRSW